MEQTRFDSVHDAYVACGAEQYYKSHGRDYRNPHEPLVAELIHRTMRGWSLDLDHVLDLAAGSGEVTRALLGLLKHDVAAEAQTTPERQAAIGRRLRLRGAVPHITAIDPYTFEAYESRTGLPCERLTFEQIGAGALSGRGFSLVICSFAMHLVVPSRLPALCWQLAQCAGQLLILTPHKRPGIRAEWGWLQKHEMTHQRVRARLYDRID